jgi:hypothetical protein
MSAVGIGLGLAANVAIGGGLAAGGKWLADNWGKEEADAATNASQAQVGGVDSALDDAKRARGEARLANDQAQAGLDPYAQAGTNSIRMQQAIAGALGPEAQQQAYAALQGGPAYAQMMDAASTGILQNASATGGLRGGNVQGALGQIGPEILQQLIQQQYGQLAGLSGQGMQAAGQQGQFGMQGAQLGLQGSQMTGQLLQDRGAYQAGGILGRQQAISNGRRELIGYGGQIVGAGAQLATGGF